MKQRSEMMQKCMRFMKERQGTGAMGERFGGPQQMFRSMMGDAKKDDDLATYGTPELQALFNDWLLQLEEEIITLLERREAVTPEVVAESLKISVESATYILDRLAQNHDKKNEDK